MEVWKDIDGFNGQYQVSNYGRIYSKYSDKILKQMPRRHGYLSVWLYGNGEGISGRNGKTYAVHRIVAQAFIPNTDNKPEVNHKNEDKADNRAENLEWVTHIENSNYGTRNERLGNANLNGKRSKPVYEYDKTTGELKEIYPSVHEVARRYGYNIGNISLVIAGKKKSAYGSVWKH